MADNVPITPGVGASVATDDVGGVQYQRVKLTLGADGVSNGDVSSSNPLPASNAASSQADGHSATVGATGDADTANTVIGRLKKIVGLLTGTLTVQGTAGGTALTVVRKTAATSTLTNVASSATNVTILAANGNRLGATIYNDSSKILYVKSAATASTTSFSDTVYPGQVWLVPCGYTGIIDGLWTAASGFARVTEYTP